MKKIKVKRIKLDSYGMDSSNEAESFLASIKPENLISYGEETYTETYSNLKHRIVIIYKEELPPPPSDKKLKQVLKDTI